MARTTTGRKKFKDTSANRKKRWNKKSPMARTGNKTVLGKAVSLHTIIDAKLTQVKER